MNLYHNIIYVCINIDIYVVYGIIYWFYEMSTIKGVTYMLDKTQPKGTYKAIMPEIFSSVSTAIETHVMLIVMERSLWKTKIKFPDAERIKYSEEGIFLGELDALEENKAEQIINEFVLSIIETLSRLVGIQVAQRLTEKLISEVKN